MKTAKSKQEYRVRRELARQLTMCRRNARDARKRGWEEQFKAAVEAIETLQELADALGWHPNTPRLLTGIYR